MVQMVGADDMALLLAVARNALRTGADITEELELVIGRSVIDAHLARVRGDVIGAVVGVHRPPRSRARSHRAHPPDWSPMVGRSSAMQELFHQAARVADRRASVAIVGEPGTGKLTLARALHRLTGADDEPALVNCAHRQWRKAWNSAVGASGTIILTRLQTLNVGAQLELAHELDGFDEAKRPPWTLAIISGAATPLERELQDRVARFTLTVPSLRDREHDVQLIISEWCRRRSRAGGVQPVVRPEAREALAARGWPGNIRQLFNALDAAVLRGGSVIGVDALELPPLGTTSATVAGSLQDVEREAIVQALARTGNNVTKAAKQLGIGRATLNRRLRAYRLMSGAGRPD